jgi:hypothetical protein
MTKRAALGRLDEAILETANDMRRLGIMDGATHGKIRLRHRGDKADAADARSPARRSGRRASART